ncbi:MAG TPA: competence protein ComK [Bacillota bacterium]|nr:competence protein ComK [Bacillota bacterium]
MEKKNEYPEFEITPGTMAIVPYVTEEGAIHTRVLEKETSYYVDSPPNKVIDGACKYFGASLKGRQEGAFDVCKFTHKVPIAIDPYSGMYYFPTESPLSHTCVWIAHTHVKEIKEAKYQQTEVTFNNGERIVVAVSYGSMQNQLYRTAHFRYQLDNRINRL